MEYKVEELLNTLSGENKELLLPTIKDESTVRIMNTIKVNSNQERHWFIFLPSNSKGDRYFFVLDHFI